MGCANSSDSSAANSSSSKNKYNESTDLGAASPTGNTSDQKSPTAPQKKQNTWMMDGESDDSTDDDGGDFTTPARKESGLHIKHDLKLTNTNSSSKRRASSLVAHSALPESAGVPRDADDDAGSDEAAAEEDEVVLFDSDHEQEGDDDDVGIAGKSHPMGNRNAIARNNKPTSNNSSSKSTTFSDSQEELSKSGKHKPLSKSGKTTSKLASLIAVRNDDNEDNCGGETRSPLKDSIEEVAL